MLRNDKKISQKHVKTLFYSRKTPGKSPHKLKTSSGRTRSNFLTSLRRFHGARCPCCFGAGFGWFPLQIGAKFCNFCMSHLDILERRQNLTDLGVPFVCASAVRSTPVPWPCQPRLLSSLFVCFLPLSPLPFQSITCQCVLSFHCVLH